MKKDIPIDMQHVIKTVDILDEIRTANKITPLEIYVGTLLVQDFLTKTLKLTNINRMELKQFSDKIFTEVYK